MWRAHRRREYVSRLKRPLALRQFLLLSKMLLLSMLVVGGDVFGQSVVGVLLLPGFLQEVGNRTPIKLLPDRVRRPLSLIGFTQRLI